MEGLELDAEKKEVKVLNAIVEMLDYMASPWPIWRTAADSELSDQLDAVGRGPYSTEEDFYEEDDDYGRGVTMLVLRGHLPHLPEDHPAFRRMFCMKGRLSARVRGKPRVRPRRLATAAMTMTVTVAAIPRKGIGKSESIPEKRGADAIAVRPCPSRKNHMQIGKRRTEATPFPSTL